MRGAGIWLRQHDDISPEDAARSLDFVVIALHSKRGNINRGPSWREWIADYQALGGKVWAMDWLPAAELEPVWLPELAEAVRERGCVGLMADCEPDAGWRDCPMWQLERYAEHLHKVAVELDVAITDYGRGGIGQKRLRVLIGSEAIGVPQSYDPQGSYRIDYHERSVDHWQEAGAERVTVGLGLWLRGERRHRTPEEFRRHLQGVPEEVEAVCAWYGQRKGRHMPLAAVLPDLKAWADERKGVRNTEPAPPTLRGELVAGVQSLAELAKREGDQGAVAELLKCATKLAG